MDSSPSDVRMARRRNAIIFFAIFLSLLLIDQASKAFFESFELGASIAGPFFGIFDITLVHNTGAAWGMFDDMTILLGILSLVVCVGAIVYLFVLAPESSPLAAVGLSLVVAGGIGNALDRFMNTYVIDFIRPVFIDFPVFNVADIGVTCGCVIFLISLVIEWVGSGKGSES